MTVGIKTPIADKDFRYALRDYCNGLSKPACLAYMQRCGVTHTYAKTQLIKKRSGPSRTPGKELIYALADESGGQVSRLQAVHHFYNEICDSLGAIIKAGPMIKFRQEQLRLPDYFYGLSDEEKSDYVQRVGSTLQYLTGHLIRRQTIPACIPNKPLLLALADESEGRVSRFQALFYFFPEIDKDLIALMQLHGHDNG